jgi:leucine-zipper of insertion element IS481
MPHRNAPLTATGRLRLARLIVQDGWPARRAAERFQVSHTTAARWARRSRQQGVAGMVDRPSRPHHSPARTPRRWSGGCASCGSPTGGAGPDRCPTGPGALHGAAGAVPLPLPAAGPPGPRQRPADPPLRARRPGRAGACGHQEAGQHPRRRRLARRGTGPGRQAPPGHHAPAAQLQAGDRLQLAAHRHGRPLPAGLHRDLCR